MKEEWVRTSESHPIRVDLLPEDAVRAPGRLGMTFAPGMWAEALGGRWERDLAADIKTLTEEYGTEMLLSLMEDEEYLYYGIPELLEDRPHSGIEVLRFPIWDMGVPQEAASEQFASFVGEPQCLGSVGILVKTVRNMPELPGGRPIAAW